MRATATAGRRSSRSSGSSPARSCERSSRRSSATTRRWRRLPRARRSRRTAALPRIRHRGRRGGALGWRRRLPSSSSPGWRRSPLSPRERPRTTAAPIRGDAVAVVDAAHARLLGSVPVGSPPGAIAYGAGSVWVSFPDSRSVSRISPESRRVAASIPLGVAAQSLAVAGSALWAVGSGPTDPYLTLERINPTFGSVSRVRRLPVVVLGDTGSLSGRGETLLVAPRTGLLTRIDARSGRTLGQLDPNAAPSAAALGFGSSWLAYREANLVVRVDSSGAITQIPVGRGPSAIAVGKRAVWVANALDGTVKSIDPATSAVITTIPVGSSPTAIATDGDSVWVASGGDGNARPDRRAQQPRHREGRDRRQPAGVGGRRRQGLGQRPDTSACPAERGNRRRGRPLVRDHARPCGQVRRRRSQVVYATCAMLLNYPDEPGAGGLRLVPDAARALPTVSKDGRSYTFTIRPGMRFSPPSNQPVTAQTFKHTIERSVDPRMKAPPGQMFLARRRRRPRVHGRQGPPHRRGRGAGRPADDSPHGARSGPAGPARDLAVLRRPHRHAEPARLRSAPLRGPVLRRLGDTGTELRPAPQSQLPRRPPAPAAADRDHRRRVTPGRPDRGVKARLRDRRRPRRGKRAARTPLRRAQRRGRRAGGSATSSTARPRSTTST